MTLTAAGAKRFLEEALRNGSPDIYISLHTGAPGATGANEQAGAAYVREISEGTDGSEVRTWTFPAAAVSNVYAATNAVRITFTTPTADYGAAITHFGFWSAETSGTFYGGFALTRNITPQNSIPLYFDPGELEITVATAD